MGGESAEKLAPSKGEDFSRKTDAEVQKTKEKEIAFEIIRGVWGGKKPIRSSVPRARRREPLSRAPILQSFTEMGKGGRVF